MNQLPSPVEQHYSREGLFEIIVQRLKEKGIEQMTRKDIAGIDEFHVRGAAVSMELAAEIGFTEDTKLLDIGCGLGGPCRMLADEFNCNVTGIDITQEFIRTAILLSEAVGLKNKVNFIQADALALPFKDESFDVVWTQHVQMNIENKSQFYSEIKRVLVKGGQFIYYDIFKKTDDTLRYPLPWADQSSLSFLMTIEELDTLLNEKGFTKVQTKDQTSQAKIFFTELFDKMEKQGASKIGLDLIMGSATGLKFGNLLNNIEEDKLELQSGMYVKQQGKTIIK